MNLLQSNADKGPAADAALRARLTKAEKALALTQQKLAEAEDLISAIRQGNLDALVICNPEGGPDGAPGRGRVYALREAEFAYRVLVEAMNEGAAIFDLQGIVQYCNRALTSLFSVDADHIIGGHITALVAPEFRAMLEAGLHKARVDGFCSFDLEFHNQAGAPLCVAASFREMRSMGLDSFCMIASDITARKNNERRLASMQERVQRILDGATNVSIVATQPDGIITVFNSGAENMLGYRHEDLVGKHSPAIFHLESEVIARGEELTTQTAREVRGFDVFIDAARTGTPEHREWTYVRKDGSHLTVSLAVTCLRDEIGAIVGYLGVGMDVTARKQAEREAIEQRIRAEAANRAKSDFLANMSHEVRTPLNAIMGMANLALRQQPTPRQQNYLTKIDSAARSLLSIMNDILDFSEMEAGKLTLERIGFSLDDVLRTSIDIAGYGASPRGLNILLSVVPDVPSHLTGDPLRLGQVVNNLLSNAVKFSERGEILLTVNCLAAGDSVRLTISVADQGIGISPDQLGNLFHSFHQADTSTTRKYGGTGLGLAISKQLCEFMDGTISVESKPGVGSTFTFTAQFLRAAPVAATSAANPPSAQPHDQGGGTILAADESHIAQTVALNAASTIGQLKGRRVLLVEDNAMNVEVATELLSGLGIEVTVAPDGQKGVDMIRKEEFDLVLMDIQMPVMDGLTAARLVRSDTMNLALPIIAMTAHAMSHDREKSLEAGMNEHLTKPINFEDLTAALLKWIPAAA